MSLVRLCCCGHTFAQHDPAVCVAGAWTSAPCTCRGFHDGTDTRVCAALDPAERRSVECYQDADAREHIAADLVEPSRAAELLAQIAGLPVCVEAGRLPCRHLRQVTVERGAEGEGGARGHGSSIPLPPSPSTGILRAAQ